MDKHGKWATKYRNGAYAHKVLLWEAIRVISFFNSKYVLSGHCPEAKRYWISRDIEDLDTEELIFPESEAAN